MVQCNTCPVQYFKTQPSLDFHIPYTLPPYCLGKQQIADLVGSSALGLGLATTIGLCASSRLSSSSSQRTRAKIDS